QDTLNLTYYSLADPLHVKVAPIGQSWRVASRNVPQITLYAGDSVHPAPAGSYLEACVLFATFYGKSPIGLPGKLTNSDGSLIIDLPADQARALQHVAWDTYLNSR